MGIIATNFSLWVVRLSTVVKANQAVSSALNAVDKHMQPVTVSLLDYYDILTKGVYEKEIKQSVIQSNVNNTSEHVPEVEGQEEENDELFDVTMVTQITTEPMRLTRLKKNILRWPGPVAVALYVKSGLGYRDPAIFQLVRFLKEHQRTNVHFVVYDGHQDGYHYPTNILRNIAISQVITEFYILLDVDFIISSTAYKNLMNNPEELELTRTQKTVLILPAFKSKSKNFNPKNKLQAKKKSSVFVPFKFHTQTNFTRWWNTEEPYNVQWDGKGYFEPYFVTHRDAPKYDERFVGRGCNKIAHVWELWLRGYTFRIMPHDFLFHLPHAYHRREHRPIVTVNCRKLFKREFMTEMKQKVKEEEEAEEGV